MGGPSAEGSDRVVTAPSEFALGCRARYRRPSRSDPFRDVVRGVLGDPAVGGSMPPTSFQYGQESRWEGDTGHRAQKAVTGLDCRRSERMELAHLVHGRLVFNMESDGEGLRGSPMHAAGAEPRPADELRPRPT